MKVVKDVAIMLFTGALVAALLTVAIVVLGTMARAQDAYVMPVERWTPHAGPPVYRAPPRIRAIKREVRRAKRQAKRERVKIWAPPVRVVAKVLPTIDVDEVCRPHIRVVGDQYASEQGAKAEADKAWSQTVRWQLGERWMDRANAKGASYECGRSSVGSIAGQVFHRCRLAAMPCRPVPSEAE